MEYFDFLKNVKNMKLDSQQRSAVSFDKGNALVLSTAGSGKTTVTIARAGRILYEKKCSRKILTITFSKMAANDMKDRFQSLFGGMYGNKAEFSTIHAFSYKIVRNFYKKKGISFNLLKNNHHVLGNILKSYYSKSYFNYVTQEEIENLASAISYVENMMIDPVRYSDFGIEIKGFDKIYKAYRSYKSQNRLIDFDDMLLYAYRIILNSDYLKNYIKNMFQYIQVDEVQDTSKIQHEIIRMITDHNLFMVGDDDQSIYSFRGSYPEFMLEFKNIYKGGKIFYLDNNYRSDKYIVEGAGNFISKNKKRYKKAINTKNLGENKINIIKVKSRGEQAKLLTDRLSGIAEGTVGILYRYNMSAIILANNFNENNINFYIKEDKTKFFTSPVLYDVLAFLNLALNPMDRGAFSRIYYKSYTYFTKNMCRIVVESPRTDLTVFDILNNCKNFDYYVYDKIRQFKEDINYINNLRPKDAVKFIKTGLEYMGYLERMQAEGRGSLANSMHILEILEEIGSYCVNIKEFIRKINNLHSVIKSASENKSSRFTLTTIHSAKGLEYDVVYMIDNIEGEFPSENRNMSEEEYEREMEEERRIFYVGMTRARKELNILVPGNPSLFVKELIQSNKNK